MYIDILGLDKASLMCYYTNKKRGRKATSRNVETKTVATVDSHIFAVILSLHIVSHLLVTDGSLFLIGVYVENYCQNNSGNAAHTSNQGQSVHVSTPFREYFPSRAVHSPPFRSCGMPRQPSFDRHTVYKGDKNSTVSRRFPRSVL